jgi:LuxR family quorum-sensing system transcriptional regulator CciR
VELGKSSPEIAIILGLSARTVEAYIERACEKLGVRTRIQAVVRARRDGLLNDVAL